MFFRVLSALFSAIFAVICSFLPVGNIKITVEPAVFDCGNDYYSVVWATSTKGSGYIEYSVNGEVRRIWDSHGGIISTDDTVHKVLVPKAELNGNSYKVVSQYVGFKYGEDAVKGKTVESTVYTFADVPTDGLKILSVSDIHSMEKEMYDSLSYFTDTPDLLVMLGDITWDMTEKKQFVDILLKDASDLSKSSIPIVYVRGNHETRGEFASQMIEYFPTETGEFYYTFDFGPLSAIVLDSGEDKQDSHEEYSGLVNFEAYREQQYNWLASLDKSEFEDAEYKLVFCHMPKMYDHFGKDWTVPLLELGMNLMVSGHKHKSDFWERDLPVFIDCGKNNETIYAASMLTLENGSVRMLTIDNSGNTLFDRTIFF